MSSINMYAKLQSYQFRGSWCYRLYLDITQETYCILQGVALFEFCEGMDTPRFHPSWGVQVLGLRQVSPSHCKRHNHRCGRSVFVRLYRHLAEPEVLSHAAPSALQGCRPASKPVSREILEIQPQKSLNMKVLAFGSLGLDIHSYLSSTYLVAEENPAICIFCVVHPWVGHVVCSAPVG